MTGLRFYWQSRNVVCSTIIAGVCLEYFVVVVPTCSCLIRAHYSRELQTCISILGDQLIFQDILNMIKWHRRKFFTFNFFVKHSYPALANYVMQPKIHCHWIHLHQSSQTRNVSWFKYAIEGLNQAPLNSLVNRAFHTKLRKWKSYSDE